MNKQDQEKNGNEEKNPWFYFEKYTYTILLLLTHMAYAMSYATFGPAFVDLKYILNSSMQWISLFSTLLSVGNILGTLFGLSFKLLNRQLTIVALLVVMAVTSSSVPFTDHLWQYYVCALFYGLGAGAWTTANNVWLIEMWQNRSEQVLFLSQLMYGVGAIIGPLIDSPYLTGEVAYNHTALEVSAHTNSTDWVTGEERRYKLKTAFLVSGAIQITLPILMSIMFAIRRYKPNATPFVDNNIQRVKICCPSEKNLKLFDRSGKPRLAMIALMSVTLAVVNSLELVFFNFGSTYMQFTPVRLTASTAASCMSVLSAAYASGQAINFLVAIFVPTKYLIGYHFLVAIGAIVGLNFAASETSLWVLSAVIGFGFSALFPAILAFVSRYIAISNRIGTIIWLTAGIVNFVPPLILGSYIENNHLVFIAIELVYLLFSSSLFIIILFVIKKYK